MDTSCSFLLRFESFHEALSKTFSGSFLAATKNSDEEKEEGRERACVASPVLPKGAEVQKRIPTIVKAA